jgi:hypothetical protein
MRRAGCEFIPSRQFRMEGRVLTECRKITFPRTHLFGRAVVCPGRRRYPGLYSERPSAQTLRHRREGHCRLKRNSHHSHTPYPVLESTNTPRRPDSLVASTSGHRRHTPSGLRGLLRTGGWLRLYPLATQDRKVRTTWRSETIVDRNVAKL